MCKNKFANIFCADFFGLFIFAIRKNRAEYTVAKLNSQKNCAQNKSLQK